MLSLMPVIAPRDLVMMPVTGIVSMQASPGHEPPTWGARD